MRVQFKFCLLLSLVLPLSACWEDSDIYRQGQHYSYQIGESKSEAFQKTINHQGNGAIRALSLLDEPSMIYNEQYSGSPIKPDDFGEVSASDKWHIGLSNCNCWLVLSFKDGILSSVEEHEWTGPTK